MRRLDWFTRLAASMLRHADAALEAEDLEEADMEASEAVEAARKLRRMRRLPQALRVYADALAFLADTADYIVSLRFAQSVKGFGEDLPDPSREEYIATSVYHATRALIVEHLDELLSLYAEKENKEEHKEKKEDTARGPDRFLDEI